jgi:hypothetical protein
MIPGTSQDLRLRSGVSVPMSCTSIWERSSFERTIGVLSQSPSQSRQTKATLYSGVVSFKGG